MRKFLFLVKIKYVVYKCLLYIFIYVRWKWTDITDIHREVNHLGLKYERLVKHRENFKFI